MMAARPQTLYGIADSPVGLAAWLLDHNDADGQPAAAVVAALDRTTSATGELTRDEILDNITLYWLTNTGVSASRLYWEYKGGFFNAKGVSIPVAVSVFPGEQYQAPRSWAERAYPNLIHFNEVDRGGHFAAWEQPQLFSEELRAAFRSLRSKTNRHERRMPYTEQPTIRPFQVDVPEEKLAELRRRIAATRWPSRELVADRSQGVQLATMQALARYWATDYDWRRCEARLNALPQFMTEIDGVDIHFIHVRSPHEDALPLIMTHGWPGSVVELLETVGPLTDPTAHGGSAEDAFHLVLPSLPGYGFSGEPTELGWDAGRIARAWAELMRRLGYTRYVAQGGDVGAAVTDAMGRQAPDGAARHPPEPARRGARRRRPAADGTPSEERAAAAALADVQGRPASATSWSRPRGRRRSATPCWTHPSPWRPGCSTTTPTATTRSPARSSTGQPAGNLTRDHILDNITLYWLTGTGASAARVVLGETARPAAAAAARPLRRSRSRSASPPSPARSSGPRAAGSRAAYPTLTYFNKVDRGGHFAAWEEPELFASEIRAAFRSLR